MLAVFTCATAARSAAQDMIIKRVPTPEPANIDELRKASKVKKLKQCKLPELRSGEGWIKSLGPDEFFEIELPPNWIQKEGDSSDTFFPDPQASFKSAKGDRIIITRQAYTSIGLPFVKNAYGVVKPQSQCEITDKHSGSFLSFYGASRGQSGRMFYQALGTGVTPQGKRYGITLLAYTPADLDTLAAIATKAILAGRSN
jgi:hypothetical protein